VSWPLVKLDEIFDVARGGSPRPIQDYITDDSDGINWVMISDATDSSKYITKTKKKIKPSGLKKSRMVQPGDFLLTNSMSFGRPYIMNTTGCIHDGWLVLSPKSENIDTSYFYHLFGSNAVYRHFSSVAAGAVVKNLNIDLVKALEIPLPPLPEQKRIAAILDKADSLRRKNQQAIQLADKFLRAVFLDMFGDPVTNPKGWDVKPLKEQIVHANNGLSRRRKETENEGHIVLRLQDVQYDGIQFEKDLNRIKLDDKEALRYKVDVDDILFIRVNGNPDYVGRSAVFKGHIEPVYHNDHLIRIKVGAAYNAEFLSYCLNFKGSRNIISTQIKTSAGQYTISQDGIERLEFFRPPIDLQNKFITLKNHTLKVPNHKIDDGLLFNALSQKAFAGEL